MVLNQSLVTGGRGPPKEKALLTLAPAGRQFSWTAIELLGPSVPPRALVISVTALAAPVIGALQFPEQLGDYGTLLWLTALLPAFTLGYYRPPRGEGWPRPSRWEWRPSRRPRRRSS